MTEKIEGGLVHAIAQCEECDWDEQYYTKAVLGAIQHTEDTGHITNVETGYYAKYGPTREQS